MPKWNIAIRADRWYGCYVMYYIKKKKKRLDVYLALDMKEPMILLGAIEWYGLRHINV